MNIIEATRKGADANPTVAVPFGEYGTEKWAKSLGAFARGEALLFGIRPHEIVPIGNSSDYNGPTFEGQIHLTEPIGDLVILDLIANGTRLKMVLPEEQPPGDQHSALLRPGDDSFRRAVGAPGVQAS